MLPNRYVPTRESLDDSLNAWPQNSRQQAEDMLFEKTFETNWNMREPIIGFSNAVIVRSRQRWLDSAALEGQVEKVQGYIQSAYAPRSLPVLHEQLALMLTDLGRQREAADLLYGFVSIYRDGVGTSYDLSLHLIAVAHELNQLGESVSVPSYDQSMKLVQEIRVSAQQEALGERLKKIRREARTNEADTHQLRQLYQSIPEELTRFNPGGAMVGGFGRMLIRGLTEAKEQKLYSGSIPDPKMTSELYNKLLCKNVRILQLFSPTFDHADIEEMTGLYLEALSVIDGTSLPEDAIALQWLAHSKWLASHNSSITSLKSLQEARNLVKKAAQHSVDIIRPMKTIRNLKCSDRGPEEAQKAGTHYQRVITQIKEKEVDFSFPMKKESTVRFHQAPFYSVPPGYALYDVPSDGLCMYHALSSMYGIPLRELLLKMYHRLHTISQIIALNLSQNAPLENGLNPSDLLIISPFIEMHSTDSNALQSFQELDYAISSLIEAINHANSGGIARSSVWGMHSLLNTAAVILSASSSLPGSPFVAQLPTLNAGGTAHTGAPQFTQYNPDGSSVTSSHFSPNGLPLLIHTEGNHWMYALPVINEPITHSTTNRTAY